MSVPLTILQASLLEFRTQLDAEGPARLLLFVDSAMPGSVAEAVGLTPASTLVLPSPSFVMSAIEASMTCTADGNAETSGLVTWAMFANALGEGLLLRSVGPPGSGAQMVISDDQDPPTSRIWTGGVLTVNYTLTDY